MWLWLGGSNSLGGCRGYSQSRGGLVELVLVEDQVRLKGTDLVARLERGWIRPGPLAVGEVERTG